MGVPTIVSEYLLDVETRGVKRPLDLVQLEAGKPEADLETVEDDVVAPTADRVSVSDLTLTAVAGDGLLNDLVDQMAPGWHAKTTGDLDGVGGASSARVRKVDDQQTARFEVVVDAL